MKIVPLQVILDEPGVKEEPQELEGEDEVTETKEIFESHHFESMAEGDSQSDQGPGFDPQMLAASQPQSVEDLVAQAIPGSSGLQGVSICNPLRVYSKMAKEVHVKGTKYPVVVMLSLAYTLILL